MYFHLHQLQQLQRKKNKRAKFNLTSRKGLRPWSSFVLCIQDRVQTASCGFKQELTETNLLTAEIVCHRQSLSLFDCICLKSVAPLP